MRLRTALVTTALALGVIASTVPVRAQSVQALFEQYLESLRRQAGIPGLSAAIAQNGRIVWERGFGYQDVAAVVAASPATPYPVGDVTETFTSTLLLQCAEEGTLDLDAPVRTWVPSADEATVRQILSHAAAGGFKFDPGRFQLLTPVVEACTELPYRQALATRILDRLAMRDSVPGADLATATGTLRELFGATSIARYQDVLESLAVAYRVDGRGNATASTPAPAGIDASTGLISTARDLVRFDAALEDAVLLRASTVDLAFTNVNAGFGLGWFVQQYKGHKLVWQFGERKDAYSSLFLKVPDRGLTLILLANSDRLAASFPLASGDVTASLFARLFLSVYL